MRSRFVKAGAIFLGAMALSAILSVTGGCGRDPAAAHARTIRAAPLYYVGQARCIECHAEIGESHLKTGHAHAFVSTQDSEIARKLCDQTLTVAPPYGPYRYVCDELGLAVGIDSRFGNRLFPLEYALGSGQHATTFLTLLKDAHGEIVGIEHRMTYYRSDDQFDVTPGQQDLEPGPDVEYFGRVYSPDVTKRCIGCHTTTGMIHGTQIDDLRPGVQCEKCHGPGSRHVAAAEQNLPALSKELIEHNWTSLQEIELCGKCHRLPSDIAADRLKRYPNSLVRFQPVGLLQSRCYLESGGKLQCKTCHPPHQPVGSPAPAEQIAACLDCHAGPGHRACPVSPQADCIRCHMPAIDLVRGIAFHDHWIRVRKEGQTTQEQEDAAHQDDHAVVPGSSRP